MTQPNTSHLSELALENAKVELGKQEIPRGSNWGEHVQKYLHSVGINFPASWCMSFVYWCFDQAAHTLGTANPLVKTGGVLHAWNNAKDHRVQVTLQPGDIFIMNFGKGLGHTGIIESIEGDRLNTIEGNTNIDGSREGIAVERKIRHTTDKKIIGYLRY